MKVVVMRQRDGGGADKWVAWIDVRANLETAAAGHAARDGVSFLLDLRRNARPRTQVVRPVNLDPALDPLKRAEHPAAINRTVSHHRKFRERFERDFGPDLVNQRRAGHPRAPVDEHRATAADGFQTILLPEDGR